MGRWAGRVARMGKKKNACRVLKVNLKQRGRFETPRLNGSEINISVLDLCDCVSSQGQS